jgi:hypothetical protein
MLGIKLAPLEAATELGPKVSVACSSLGAATLPPTLKVVGEQREQLFVKCRQLHSIALAMTRTPDGCLRRDKSLKVLALRKSVGDAVEGAFEGCDSLETLRSEE